MVDRPGKANLRDHSTDHRINKIAIESASITQRRKDANLRDWFLDKDNNVITGTLKQDLGTYVDGFDISRMKLITLDEYLAAFMQNLLHVYDSNPAIKFTLEEEDKPKKDSEGNIVPPEESEDMERFRELLNEVDWVQAMRDDLIQARLHNTAIVEVKYNDLLDKMYIQNYNIGNAWVSEMPDFFLEWEIFAYELWSKDGETSWIVWDRGADKPQHYEFRTKKDLPHFDASRPERLVEGDKFAIGNNEDTDAPTYDSGELPLITYRYERHNDFWGNGMDSIIELLRSVNVLLTIVNDDTIQETIRLLILNFTPSGSEGDKGQLKAGLRHPIMPASSAPGVNADPKADVVSADLYNEDVLELIDKLLDMVSNMYEVDNPIRNDVEESLSGIALRIRAEPILQHWQEDIGRVRKPDMELFRALIDVNNLNREDNKIDIKILDKMSIDYTEPNIVKDEAGEYALERQRWADNLSNPVAYLQRTNPEMTKEQAVQEIEVNKLATAASRGQSLVLVEDEPGLEI